MADFLSQAELDGFQALSESAMRDTATVYARSTGRNGRERTVEFAARPEASGVKCRVADASRGARESSDAGAPETDPLFDLVLPLGTPVEEGDAVRVQVKQTGETHLLTVDKVARPETYAVDVPCLATRFDLDPSLLD